MKGNGKQLISSIFDEDISSYVSSAISDLPLIINIIEDKNIISNNIHERKFKKTVKL